METQVNNKQQNGVQSKTSQSNERREKNNTRIAFLSLIVAIATWLIMYNIYDLQKKDNDKQNQIIVALANGDAEFEKNNWEEAYQHYHIADSLGSTDRKGYMNFRNKAYEQEKILGKCNHTNRNLFRQPMTKNLIMARKLFFRNLQNKK